MNIAKFHTEILSHCWKNNKHQGVLSAAPYRQVRQVVKVSREIHYVNKFKWLMLWIRRFYHIHCLIYVVRFFIWLIVNTCICYKLLLLMEFLLHTSKTDIAVFHKKHWNIVVKLVIIPLRALLRILIDTTSYLLCNRYFHDLMAICLQRVMEEVQCH